MEIPFNNIQCYWKQFIQLPPDLVFFFYLFIFFLKTGLKNLLNIQYVGKSGKLEMYGVVEYFYADIKSS